MQFDSTPPHLPLTAHYPRLVIGNDMNPADPALCRRVIEPVCVPKHYLLTQGSDSDKAFLPIASRLFEHQWLWRVDHRS